MLVGGGEFSARRTPNSGMIDDGAEARHLALVVVGKVHVPNVVNGGLLLPAKAATRTAGRQMTLREESSVKHPRGAGI